MSELILFMGLPASGKSSFYQDRFRDTHQLVSKDLMKNKKNKDKRQAKQLRSILEQKLSTVLDNTNPSRTERAKWIEIGREFGARITGYYFSSSLKECLPRNAARENPVPEVALFSIAKSLERPQLDEGFDELFFVKLSESGFKVLPWEEQAIEP